MLIDCGASSLIAMKRAGVDPSAVGWVLLTHLHGDHFGGLPFLVLDGQFSRRTRPLVIAGPPGVRSRVEAAMEVFFPGSTTVERRLRRSSSSCCRVGPSLSAPPARRRFPSSTRAGRVVRAAGGRWRARDRLLRRHRVDGQPDRSSPRSRLFVCEAYTFERKIRYHLDYATLRAEAARLGCRRIVLTHMGPTCSPERWKARSSARPTGS